MSDRTSQDDVGCQESPDKDRVLVGTGGGGVRTVLSSVWLEPVRGVLRLIHRVLISVSPPQSKMM